VKSIVIVGVAARSFRWAPDDEVWVINRAGAFYSDLEWHRWFHLHGPDHIRAAEGPDHLAHLIHTANYRTVYTPRGEEQVPGSLAFPYARILESMHVEADPATCELLTIPHFHNSFPLLIAFAVLEGATRITLDGVQFGYDKPTEQWAVAAIEFHLGRAVGLGVSVRVPHGSGLMTPHHLYGLAGPGCI
jgi:hypothetical protein